MNGAHSLVRTLLASGVDTCFANPGTSEMHFVAALDSIEGMHCVLGLFEGVVTGAADGYGRMADRPAATLLHCGPGLANGLANLHNARRARVPIVNLVGDQATHHRPLDALLTADTEGWASGVSCWTRTARHARDVGHDVALAVSEASSGAGGIATLILPSDVCWSPGGVVGAPVPSRPPAPVPPEIVEAVREVLLRGEPTVFVLAGPCLRAGATALADAIARKTGARLMAPPFVTRAERGQGRVDVPRIPYPINLAVEALAGFRHVVLVGADEPVAFFAYPGMPGRLFAPDAEFHVLARPDEDGPAALAALAGSLGVRAGPIPAGETPRPGRGAVTPEATAATLAALLPENAVIIDEGLTFGACFYAAMANAAPHDWLQLGGGAIGAGLPMSVGAALGAPGRRVVAVQADGSGLYTLQALWTQAREKLDVTSIILSNRRYAILEAELTNVGATPGPTALSLFDLANPAMDWVRLAEGFGVEAARAEDQESLADLFARANSRPGPFVIELVIG